MCHSRHLLRCSHAHLCDLCFARWLGGWHSARHPREGGINQAPAPRGSVMWIQILQGQGEGPGALKDGRVASVGSIQGGVTEEEVIGETG